MSLREQWVLTVLREALVTARREGTVTLRAGTMVTVFVVVEEMVARQEEKNSSAQTTQSVA